MTLLQQNQSENQESYPIPVEDIGNELENALEACENPSEAVAQVFTDAIAQYPNENVAKLWLRGIYDKYQELNTESSNLQSWRNIGGIAFEKAVVSYYNTRLPKYLQMKHVSGNPEIQDQLSQLARRQTEIDVSGENFGDAVLLGEHNGEQYLYGVVQTMTSFKGRLGDEAWKGELVQDLGLFAPLVTLDSASNTNNNLEGEVGQFGNRNVPGRIIEEDGSFTNMYSFNSNTDQTTWSEQPSRNQIWNIGSSEFDALINDSIEAWSEFIQPMKQTQMYQIES